MANGEICWQEFDRLLMRRIFQCWGAAIHTACWSSSVPPEFLAALIANESAGEAERRQFHPDIHEHLLSVRSGKEFRFAGMKQEDLVSLSHAELIDCATGWGLTQIMGFRALQEGDPPCRLLIPEFNLKRALRQLAAFSEECLLDMRKEFEELFQCWTKGSYDGITTGPEYAKRGLRRLALYRELTNSTLEATRAAA